MVEIGTRIRLKVRGYIPLELQGEKGVVIELCSGGGYRPNDWNILFENGMEFCAFRSEFTIINPLEQLAEAAE